MKNYDVIIIGAGAAGLMCAAFSSKRGRKVLLIDHSKKVGEKIRISGGGKCNFTNIYITSENFISQNPYFAISALQRFDAKDFIAMIEKHKITFHEKTLGQLFCNISSQQIIDMLLTECKEGGVEILTETLAKNIKHLASEKKFESAKQNQDTSNQDANKDSEKLNKISRQNFTLKIENKNDEGLSYMASCQSLVIATGGLSIPKMGASSFGYDIARKFGLNIIETYPALVPLTLDKSMLEATKNLAGVAVDAIVKCEAAQERSSFVNASKNFTITKKTHNKSTKSVDKIVEISFREAILFTHRGLSGPAILQISSYLKKNQEIIINLVPDHDIFNIFLNEKKQKPKQEIVTILHKYLPKSLANYIAQSHAAQGNIADMSNQKLKEIANNVNAWKICPEGDEGYAKAEVTAGGIDTNEISSKTFECKSVQGLYFIGEVLDVTGHLGGFNFQWAWASAFASSQFV